MFIQKQNELNVVKSNPCPVILLSFVHFLVMLVFLDSYWEGGLWNFLNNLSLKSCQEGRFDQITKVQVPRSEEYCDLYDRRSSSDSVINKAGVK